MAEGRRAFLLLPVLLAACTPAAGERAPAHISANDNLRPAGTARGAERVIDLDLVRGRWYPEADDGPSLEILALGERGLAPSIPSPLIRVTEGTRVRVRVRNTLADRRVVLHGLHARPGPDDTL